MRACIVWASRDGGFQWTLLTMSAAFSPRTSFVLVTTNDNILIIIGGGGFEANSNDMLISFDGAMQWYQCSRNIPTLERRGASSLLLPDQQLIVIGGIGSARNNAVWQSPLSLNDTTALQQHCISSDGDVVNVTTTRGLRYWPWPQRSSNATLTSQSFRPFWNPLSKHYRMAKYPLVLSFNHTNGTLITFPPPLMILLSMDDYSSNDVRNTRHDTTLFTLKLSD